MFQGIFKSAINDANKNYIFGTGSIPIQIKTAQLATFADGTTKQQGYQVAEVNKLISTLLTGWDANGNKPKSMSDNYLELILSCDNGFVVKKRLQFPHIIAWKDDSTQYNIADIYKEFSLDNWLKADDFENPDITLVVEPTDEILTTSTATPPEVTTTNSGRFYLYYRNLPVGVNRIHIDFHIKTKTEPIDFDLEILDGLSLKDAQAILSTNEQAKINVLLGTVKDVYNFTGAEGNFENITMHEWSALYQQIISLAPSNKFTHDLYFYIYDESEINTKITELETSLEENIQKTNNLDNVINGSEIVTWEDVGYSDDYQEINAHRQGRYINFKKYSVGSDVSSFLHSNGVASDNGAFARCAIKQGTTYRVYGLPNAYACLVITDENAIIVTKIESGDYTQTPYEFTADSDGYLFVQTVSFLSWETCKATFEKVEKTNSLVKDVEQLKNVNNPLAGKTFVLFGDSLSEFAGTDGKTYSQHIEDITGAKIINCAIGGTRFGVRNPNYQTPTSEGRAWACVDIANMVYAACSGDYTYIDAGASFLKTLGYNVDGAVANVKSINWDEVYGVIVEGGSNDFTGSVSPTHIGTDDDDDFFTTKGAVNYMVKMILTAHPNVKLCFESNQVVYVAPPNFDASTSYNVGDVCKYESNNYKFINPHSGEWNDSDVLLISLAKDWRHPSAWCDNYKNFDGLTNAEFINEIQNLVVHKHHIPYINMYDLLGWNQFNFSTFFEDYDNHHPYKGFKIWADKLSKQLMLL